MMYIIKYARLAQLVERKTLTCHVGILWSWVRAPHRVRQLFAIFAKPTLSHFQYTTLSFMVRPYVFYIITNMWVDTRNDIIVIARLILGIFALVEQFADHAPLFHNGIIANVL